MSDTATYGVALISDVTADVISAVKQNSLDTARKCSNNLKCILSWDGDAPAGLSVTTYTYDEMLALVNDETDEWYVAPPPIPEMP